MFKFACAKLLKWQGMLNVLLNLEGNAFDD